MDNNYLNELRKSTNDMCCAWNLVEKSHFVSYRTIALCCANNMASMRIVVEWQELRIFVYLSRLHPDEDCMSVVGYDADDLIELRHAKPSPVGRMFRRKAPGKISRIMDMYSKSLLASASDIFQGDFQVFSQLEKIVLERARSFSKEEM
jgi:hypothetical protein